jgi:hypothetical protein
VTMMMMVSLGYTCDDDDDDGKLGLHVTMMMMMVSLGYTCDDDDDGKLGLHM